MMEVIMRALTDAELDAVSAAGAYKEKRNKHGDVKIIIAGNKVLNFAGSNTGVLQQGLVNVNTGNVSYTGNISYS